MKRAVMNIIELDLKLYIILHSPRFVKRVKLHIRIIYLFDTEVRLYNIKVFRNTFFNK